MAQFETSIYGYDCGLDVPVGMSVTVKFYSGETETFTGPGLVDFLDETFFAGDDCLLDDLADEEEDTPAFDALQAWLLKPEGGHEVWLTNDRGYREVYVLTASPTGGP